MRWQQASGSISVSREDNEMDIFSFTVLEDTLNELTAKPILADGNERQDECVTAIRACMELIALHPTNETYTDKIRHALTELARIARQNGEFLIAARIRTVEHQLAFDEGFSKRRAIRVAQVSP
jgi:hypothetical protein